MVHQPVLLQETLEGLNIQADGIYIDTTFGRGGHSQAILERLSEKGKLIAIDKDAEAVSYAKEHFGEDKRFRIYHDSFSHLDKVTRKENIYGLVNGILLDLGVSSPQLDNPARGFSFMQQGPLDMRMNQHQSFTATQFINESTENEMAKIFKEYGEERFSHRIAKAIVAARKISPITTTSALAEIIKQAHPRWEKYKHPATRVFQAIRIFINQELNDLIECLEATPGNLAPGGRLVVISFHSLEDRMVKQFIRAQEQGPPLPNNIPLRYEEMPKRFKKIGKAIKASIKEVKENIRARSAVLRIGEKIA